MRAKKTDRIAAAAAIILATVFVIVVVVVFIACDDRLSERNSHDSQRKRQRTERTRAEAAPALEPPLLTRAAQTKEQRERAKECEVGERERVGEESATAKSKAKLKECAHWSFISCSPALSLARCMCSHALSLSHTHTLFVWSADKRVQ